MRKHHQLPKRNRHLRCWRYSYWRLAWEQVNKTDQKWLQWGLVLGNLWGKSLNTFFSVQGSTWQYLLMMATCLRSSSVLMSRYLRIILKVEYVLRRLDSWTVIERCSELWCFIGFPLLRSEDHEWRPRGDSCKEQSSCSGPQHSLYRLIGHLGNSKTSDQEIEHWLEGIFVTYRYCH